MVRRIIQILILFALSAHTALAGPTKPCAELALQTLKEVDSFGYGVYSSLGDPSSFTFWLDCSLEDFGLSTAVHESVHRLSNDGLLSGMRRFYGLPSGGSQVQFRSFFPVKEISSDLGANEKDDIYQIYLTGAKGEQDLISILDELNAYTRGMQTRSQIFQRYPDHWRYGERDSTAKFMLYLSLYLQRAATAHPTVWKSISEDPEYVTVIRNLWRNAEAALANSCQIPQMGINDGYWLKRAYDDKSSGPLKKILAVKSIEIPQECKDSPSQDPGEVKTSPVGGVSHTVRVSGVQKSVPYDFQVNIQNGQYTINGVPCTATQIESFPALRKLFEFLRQMNLI